jgi:hypothetical protein
MNRATMRRSVVVALLVILGLIVLAILVWPPAPPEIGSSAAVRIERGVPAPPPPPLALPVVEAPAAEPPEPEVEPDVPEAPAEPELLIVRGRVTMRDGAPVVGADVKAQRITKIENGVMYADAGATRSGEGGSFKLALPPGAKIRLYARQDGFLPTTIEVQLAEVDQELILLVLEIARTLRGHVVDLTGDPVAGADVNVRVKGPGDEYREIGRAESGEDGGFAFETIPPGVTHIRLGAAKAGAGTGVTILPVSEALAAESAIVMLDPDRALRIHVLETESGRPVESPRIRIHLFLATPPNIVNGRLVSPPAVIRCKREASGSWLVVGAPDEGRLMIGITARARTGYFGKMIRLDEFPLMVRLEARDVVRISGTVVDERGRPVRVPMVSASIVPGDRGPPRSSPGGGFAKVDEDGRFEIDDLDRGYTYRLEAMDRITLGSVSPPVDIRADADRDGVVLRLERIGRIRGYVTSAEEGQKLKQLTLSIDRSRADASSPDRTLPVGWPQIDLRETGRFVVGRLLPGLYNLRLLVPDHVPFDLRDVRIEAGKVTDVGRVVVERGFRLLVTLLGPDGRPCQDLRVRAVRMPDMFVPSGKQNDSGRVAFRRMLAGEYRLFATGDDCPVTDLGTVVLGDEAETDISRVIEPGGHLVIVVRDRDGAAIPSAKVDLTGSLPPPFDRVLVAGFRSLPSWPFSLLRGRPLHQERVLVSDQEGRRRVGPLQPGRYVASAGTSRRTIEIRSGETTEIVFTRD